MERRALIYNVTSKKLFQLHGSNPHTVTFGTQADISNSVILDGMSGCTTETRVLATHIRRSALDDVWALPEMREM